MFNLKVKRKKGRAFVNMPKAKRLKTCFQLGQQMRNQRRIYGGRFTSDDLLIEMTEEAVSDGLLCNQWFDFFFLGLKKHELWNAEILTARQAFWDEVEFLAVCLANDAFPETLEPGNVTAPEWLDLESYDEEPLVDGLTYSEFLEQTERKIISVAPPEICECFELDRSHKLGVGLRMVVDAESLSYPLIDDVIDRFFAAGQKAWRSDQPVPREKLPFKTQSETALTQPMFSALPTR
ncbi:MAG: hypothetical protein LBJ64_10850 [Deltaproteobacteria bacterium]|nr:hypothetical protein [Deltaproteobacteria bacterium]